MVVADRGVPCPRVLGVDDVVGAVREPHPVGVAQFHGEDRPPAIPLHAAKHAEGLIRGAVLEGRGPVHAEGESFEVLARHHVDDAAHRFRAVEGGGAVQDGLDPADGDGRIHAAHVHPGALAAWRRVRRQAMPVHHGHGGSGAEAAQVGPHLRALVALLIVGLPAPLVIADAVLSGLRTADALERGGIGVDAELERLVEDHIANLGVAGHLDVDVVEDGLGRWQVEVVAPDVRSRYEHFLDVAVDLFDLLLGIFLIVILGRRAQGAKRQRE